MGKNLNRNITNKFESHILSWKKFVDIRDIFVVMSLIIKVEVGLCLSFLNNIYGIWNNLVEQKVVVTRWFNAPL